MDYHHVCEHLAVTPDQLPHNQRDPGPWFAVDRRLHQDLWQHELEEFARRSVGGEAQACGLCF